MSLTYLKKCNEDYVRTFCSKLGDVKEREVIALRERLEALIEKFREFDDDNSGDIDLTETKKLLKDKTPQEIKELMIIVDDDNTGTLRYWEFVNLMLIVDGTLEEPINEDERLSNRRRSTVGRRTGKIGKRKGALKKKRRGHLKLKLELEEEGTGYLLNATIYEGRDLLPMDLNGLSDPYVKLKLEPDTKKASKQKTKVAKTTLNPTFNESFSWKIPPGSDLKGMKLTVNVWDWDRFTANDFMGAMAFQLTDILDPLTITDGWFVLLDEVQGQMHHFRSRNVEALNPADGSSVKRRAKPSTLEKRYAIDSFNYMKVLGRGNYGKVFLCEHKETEQICAVKVLKKSTLIKENDIDACMTERQILSMKGEFLNHMFACFQTEANLFFVLELLNGGDLLFHLMNKGALGEDTARFYVAEISLALFFLHDNDIIYRDLKPDNILLDGQGHVRITDFGLSKMNVPKLDGMTSTFCGTPDFIAPEVIRYQPYNRAVDFWSLGVVMYEMLQGQAPFGGEQEEELFESILHEKIFFPAKVSKACKQVLQGFLRRDPIQRLGNGDNGEKNIRNHAWFNKLSWSKLEQKKVKAPLRINVKGQKDINNFDPEFTKMKAIITPTDDKAVAGFDQELFNGFSFVDGLESDVAPPKDDRLSYYGFNLEHAVPSSATDLLVHEVPDEEEEV